MKLVSVTLLGAVMAVAVSAQADTPAPQPGPEWQKLGYYIGTWRANGVMQPTKSFPGGKFDNVTSHEWIENGFFYLTRHEEHNPTGTHTMVGITGYDPEKKAYVSYYFDEGGGVSQETGSLDGDVWTWNGEFKTAKGERIETRSVDTPVSATSYKFIWQIRRSGGDWITLQQGTATKVN